MACNLGTSTVGTYTLTPEQTARVLLFATRFSSINSPLVLKMYTGAHTFVQSKTNSEIEECTYCFRKWVK